MKRLKMDANNQKLKDGSVLNELVSIVRKLTVKLGKVPSYTELKQAAPNHKTEYYRRAIDIYRDEQLKALNCSIEMPKEIKDMFDELKQDMWSYLVFSHQSILEKIKENCERQVSEARIARDQALEALEAIQEKYDLQKEELQKLSEALTVANKTIEDQKEQLSASNGALTSLKVQFEQLQKIISNKLEPKEKPIE